MYAKPLHSNAQFFSVFYCVNHRLRIVLILRRYVYDRNTCLEEFIPDFPHPDPDSPNWTLLNLDTCVAPKDFLNCGKAGNAVRRWENRMFWKRNWVDEGSFRLTGG